MYEQHPWQQQQQQQYQAQQGVPQAAADAASMTSQLIEQQALESRLNLLVNSRGDKLQAQEEINNQLTKQARGQDIMLQVRQGFAAAASRWPGNSMACKKLSSDEALVWVATVGCWQQRWRRRHLPV
jgi:dTDP-4-dehydrorhamnose reductase